MSGKSTIEMIRSITIFIPLLLLAFSGTVAAGTNEPISGTEYEVLIASQYPEVQEWLGQLFPESQGYIILGPIQLDSNFSASSRIKSRFRLICTTNTEHEWIAKVLTDSAGVGQNFRLIGTPRDSKISLYSFKYGKDEFYITVYTGHSFRASLWEIMIRTFDDFAEFESSLHAYAAAIDDKLASLELGEVEGPFPMADSFGVPERFGFYAKPPDYVIQGYQNYKDLMSKNTVISTEFVSGVYEIKATDDLLETFKKNAPKEAYRNKEAAKLQEELKTFFERGGKLQQMNSLTAIGFDTLKAGEYFFAVSLSGRIRFGRELLREEVERIEKETGRKLPRANHSFLFPGEPILTAGAFVIEMINGTPNIVKVNAGSGHYFYSNISPTIRNDIVVRSNHYLLTLGHFFSSLNSLGLSYSGITISKF